MCMMITILEMFLTTQQTASQQTEWDHVETIPEVFSHDTPTPLHPVCIGYQGYPVQGLYTEKLAIKAVWGLQRDQMRIVSGQERVSAARYRKRKYYFVQTLANKSKHKLCFFSY